MIDDSLPTPGVDSATDTPNIKSHQRARPTGPFPTGTDCHRDYNYLNTTQHLQANFSVFIRRGHHQQNVPGPTGCSFSLPSIPHPEYTGEASGPAFHEQDGFLYQPCGSSPHISEGPKDSVHQERTRSLRDPTT